MAIKVNKVDYCVSEKEFYKYLKQHDRSEKLKEYLINNMRTFECVKTGRSKPIYNPDGKKMIWLIHIPNPSTSGKNAYRMLCFINKEKSEIYLGYIFNREYLNYKGSKNKEHTKKWDECIKFLKKKYF
ncbi:MAG: hypothetical protein OXU73_00975 [Candidatus Campbellbacteria bacterium]|nr:hypothetical protein [Candidatus Campbellbacteria bacterium]